jgi:glycosyltransferase involved in cell wall biosynthesis
VKNKNIENSIIVFCQSTVSCNFNTGIQRYVRILIKGLVESGVKVIPVKFSNNELVVLNKKELKYLGEFNGPEYKYFKDIRKKDILYAKKIVMPEIFFDETIEKIYEFCKKNNKKLVSVFYDGSPFILKNVYSKKTQESYLNYMKQISISDLIICISESSKKDYDQIILNTKNINLKIKAILCPHEKIKNIPEVSDKKNIEAVYISSFDKRKNHIKLISAYEKSLKILKSQGYDLKLSFISGYNSEDKEYNDLLYKRCLENDIEIFINVSDKFLIDKIKKSDFSIYSSLHEGFGLPIVESLSWGIPVICSNNSSMAEVASFGGCLTFNPNSINDMSNTIIKISMNKKKREYLIEEIKDIKGNFLIDYSEKFLKEIENI